ncbi:MAG TPA: hypothetical protein VMD25_12165 [Acidobacteriaceae bacterium]|nr:hypothetical protein [Acidobacteriaceae bacterium]
MRRVLAAMLVLVFSAPLIAPIFTGTVDEAALPACCRRNGKHHCMMYAMMMGQVPGHPVVSEKCPYSPFAGLAVMLPHAFASHRHAASVRYAAVLALAVPQAEAGYRISFHRARQKRGPPLIAVL